MVLVTNRAQVNSISESTASVTGRSGVEVFVAQRNIGVPPVIVDFEPGIDLIGLPENILSTQIAVTMWPGGHTLLTHTVAPQAGLFIIQDVAPWDFDAAWFVPLRTTVVDTPIPTPPAPQPQPPIQEEPAEEFPIPLLDQWENEMYTLGVKNGEFYTSSLQNPGLTPIDWYWDSQRMFEQMGDYTGDPLFYEYSDAAQTAYAEKYLIPSNYVVNAFRVHTEGLAMKYERTGDIQSAQVLEGLTENGLFIRPATPIESLYTLNRNREVAYALKAYINSERAGVPEHPRRNELVEVVLNHLDQVIATDNPNPPAIKVFMTGLSLEAIIQYYEYTGRSDERVPDKVYQVLDVLWQRGYDADSGSMKYWSEVPQSWQEIDADCLSNSPIVQYPYCLTNPAPDLNLIVAPAYAWAWKETGEDRFRIRGDKLFESGIQDGYTGTKQINQRYWWSFKYVEWRSQ
jgi:hypothetical protein